MTLEQVRKAAHLSKEAMARALGVSTRSIYNYEHGLTPVTPMVVYAYAGVAGVDPDEIEPPGPAGQNWKYLSPAAA